ncbi:MAG: KH domain-containing protein [Armatimonadetes bacterium]|nr:KH domain-containing protein [Armatimonadota bacterium]
MDHEQLVDHLVKSIVSEPESVSVDVRNERGDTVYYISVAPGDVGKMIGKNGRVISALRTLVSAAAAKARRRSYVKVNTD